VLVLLVEAAGEADGEAAGLVSEGVLATSAASEASVTLGEGLITVEVNGNAPAEATTADALADGAALATAGLTTTVLGFGEDKTKAAAEAADDCGDGVTYVEVCGDGVTYVEVCGEGVTYVEVCGEGVTYVEVCGDGVTYVEVCGDGVTYVEVCGDGVTYVEVCGDGVTYVEVCGDGTTEVATGDAIAVAKFV
jgi:predicted RNA-binding protein